MKKSVLLALVVCLCAFNSFAEQILPPDLQDVSINENLGATLPFDAEFKNEMGETVTLGSYYQTGRPVLVNLVYYECAMLCNLVLNGMTKGLNELDWVPGKEFDIVTISIDESETPALAKEKKAAYINTLKKKQSASGWHFLTGSKENIAKVAGTIGFRFNKIAEKDIAHGAALYLSSPKGVLSRYLYGIEYSGRDLKRGLLDAMEGKQISVADKVFMFCYRYSKDSRGYVLFADNFMTGSGALVLLLVMGLLGGFWFNEFKRRKRKVSAQVV